MVVRFELSHNRPTNGSQSSTILWYKVDVILTTNTMQEGFKEAPRQEPEKLQLTSEQLEQLRKRVERAEKMADLLDKKYLDPIIGLLIPEGGDAVTALAGLYLI